MSNFMTINEITAYRAHYRTEIIPRYYSGKAHIAFLVAFVLGSYAVIVPRINGMSLGEFVVFPATLLFNASLIYFIHRFMLHRKLPLYGWAYDMHEIHHRVYTSKNMQFENYNDIYMLLMPMHVVAMYYLAYVPFTFWLASKLGAPNIQLLVALGSATFYGLYELVHFVSHFSSESPWLRLAPLRAAWRHHQFHHDRRIMNACNFDIVSPLFDNLLSTTERDLT